MFEMLPDFKLAFQKASLVNRELTRNAEGFAALTDIVKTVKNLSGYDIKIIFVDFSEIRTPAKDYEIKQAGAMLQIAKSNKVHLMVNKMQSACQNRFSIVHELGHLLIEMSDYTYTTVAEQEFTVSTHINADITRISKEDCQAENFYMAEQMANIFALLILIPDSLSIQRLTTAGVKPLCKRYGVEEQAIYSRMLISHMWNISNK